MFRGARKVFNYIFSVAKVFFLFLIVFLLPRLFMLYLHTDTYATPSQFKLGIENVSKQFLQSLSKSGKNIEYAAAIVTNQTGKSSQGKRSIDILINKGVQIKKIFAPEHGIAGKTLAGKDVSDSTDKKTHIPIISLYGTGKTKGLTKKNIEHIDVLFFDMQDCGMRHYTYITTMFQTMDTARKHGKKVVIFDRPNLLGPFMEGPLVEPELKSAISYAPIPLRYGMTIGELARYYNKYILKKPAKLFIVPMKKYDRKMPTQNVFIAPLSPNIKNIHSCHGYSLLGLLGEVRPFYTGVGTNKAFQYILLPDSTPFQIQKWKELHEILKELYGIDTTFYRCRKGKKSFSGLQILNSDKLIRQSSFNLLMNIIGFFQNAGVTFVFSKLFNKAVGTDKVIQYFNGKIKRKKLQNKINTDLSHFYAKASSCFIYAPSPKIKYADF